METLTFDAALTESAQLPCQTPRGVAWPLEMATALVHAEAVWLEEDGYPCRPLGLRPYQVVPGEWCLPVPRCGCTVPGRLVQA